jgi:hypothetical protein
MKTDHTDLAKMTARFVSTQTAAGISHLSAGDRAALSKILEAGACMEEIFLRQVWAGNAELRRILGLSKSMNATMQRTWFDFNKGPWSRVDHNKAFIPGVPSKPKGANFYPEDMSAKEFTRYLAAASEEERAQATGFFHVMRRKAGKLVPVPYSKEYAEFLEPAAQLLREAATLTDNDSLRRFLNLRAKAFETDDYFASDLAWMDLDAPLEVVIGPYEVYEDGIFNYKAAFEAFVTVVNPEETAKLQKYLQYRQEIEDHLPMYKGHRNPKVGTDSPLRVVDVIAAFGEANAGMQTQAFNLPNDEKVIEQKGSKVVLLRNVIENKFNHVVAPIAHKLLRAELAEHASFDALFTHIVWHELLHGLGPHNIKVGGRATTVRQKLKDAYSAIEETKADIVSLWSLDYMIDKGVFPADLRVRLYASAVADMFRCVRSNGIKEAHGQAVAAQFNYLCDAGGIVAGKDGRFDIDVCRMKAGIAKFARVLLTIEARGDYTRAKALLKRYARIRPRMARALASLGDDVPLDINQSFTTAEDLLPA